jgi:phosphoribosylanthranilate isomerase
VSIAVKICGLTDTAAVDACVEGGARYAGFNFYPKSPRFIGVAQASSLIAQLPEHILSVGLFVDADDDDILRVTRDAPLRMIQLHGSETSSRVAAVNALTGLPVIKAVGISSASDLAHAHAYEAIADMLLLDAKPIAGGLPGGNATSFDWSLLSGVAFARPWMLAGGLNVSNIAQALAVTGARRLDVSSGVEDAPGHKNPQKIKEFLALAARN